VTLATPAPVSRRFNVIGDHVPAGTNIAMTQNGIAARLSAPAQGGRPTRPRLTAHDLSLGNVAIANARIMALDGSSTIAFDAMTPITEPDEPSTFALAPSTDGVHSTDYGQALLGNALADLLRRRLDVAP